MKKFLVAGLALSMLAGGTVTASAQPGQYGRGYDNSSVREQRQDRREARQDAREDRREARQDARAFRRAERRFSIGRYAAPRGYQQRQWGAGQRLPAGWYGSRYKIANYSAYGLNAPPRGYQWTRVGNDAVLTAVATGVIAGLVASLFN